VYTRPSAARGTPMQAGHEDSRLVRISVQQANAQHSSSNNSKQTQAVSVQNQMICIALPRLNPIPVHKRTPLVTSSCCQTTVSSAVLLHAWLTQCSARCQSWSCVLARDRCAPTAAVSSKSIYI
jgi:hypothetical protein